MNQTTKKSINTLKSPTKVTLVRSRSSDHLLSVHQKSITRKNNMEKTNTQQNQGMKNPCLSQSKSTKSHKNHKTKSVPKSTQTKSTKKIKNKNKNNTQISQTTDNKTVKKQKNIVKVNLSQQSFNSIETIPKKQQLLQYFLYQNTYIPIQNSAQRRFVYKIKQIDNIHNKNHQQIKQIKQRNNESTSDGFYLKPLQFTKNTQDTQIQTQKQQIIQFGTNTTPRVQHTISVQTAQNKEIFKQDINKCFSQTLTDLQFLYLPDEKNFQGFSKLQKIHYKELFQSIAKKIWQNGSQNLQQLTDQKVHLLLYQRQCTQMGMLQFYPEQGFPTHIFSVMSYLTNLFSFAQMNYKEQILERIQHIYGYGHQERFSRVLKGLSTKKKCLPVLSDSLFLELQNQLFKDHQFSSEIVEKSVHVHNRILFDAANEQLQKFKPFYQSKGQPFPWSINLGMTFFSIDQSCLHLLFKQIKQKILLKFGYLCGMIVDYEEFKPLQNNQKHPIHIKKIQEQSKKIVQEQNNQINFSPEFEEWNITFKNSISKKIFNTLIQQICNEIQTN